MPTSPVSRPARSTPATSLIRRPARSSRRSTRPAPTSRTASGGLRGGYEYSRSANPTRTALEGALAAVEEGERGFAFASGLAAEDAILRALTAPGDHAVDPRRRLRRHLPALRQGRSALGARLHARRPLRRRRGARRDPARRDQLVWVETPTNPLLNIGRHRGARRGRPRRAARCSSSTTPSPRRTSSSRSTLGADVVVHSTTKYVGGHSDVVGGARGRPRPRPRGAASRFHQNAMGAVAGPFDCFLTHRGLKTLGVRMDRHCDNARGSSSSSTGHPEVSRA